MKHRGRDQEGYALLGVIVLLTLSLVLTMGMLNSAATSSKTRHLVRTQADNYYEVERTLNNVVGWLQDNSKSLVTPYMAANFGGNFQTGVPAAGDNEGQHFDVPTLVKMSGTNDSVMLSNNAFFGDSAFPAAEHIDTGTSFNAASEFQNADLGDANARIILVWARETDGNYEPVYRVDVMTGNNPDRGVHSYSYVYSTLVTSNGAMNFFGRDFLTLQTPNNDCSSYQYSHNAGAGTWSSGAERANCGVASNGVINISSKVNGTAKSLADSGVSLNPPGGDVSGDVCEGAGCHGYALPTFDSWAVSCPAHNGDLNVSADMTLAAGGCWRDVDISNNKTLYLTDTNNPYYFRTVNFKANFAHLNFGVAGKIPEGETITVYIQEVDGDHVNGNQFYNALNAPHQVEFNYTGVNQLKLNGTASFNALVTAPYAPVVVNGNFEFYGGIWATNLTISGNAEIFGDEQVAGVPVISDINFSLKKTSQRYR